MNNNREPLVSILIPAHNCEKWISATIQSALAQTWTNTEIIVVDDGSTDATLAIAKRYESSKVRVVTQPNQGAAAARNKAYSLCQGECIQWLDGDDLLDPDKVRLQICQLNLGAGPRTLLSSAWGYFFHRHQKAKFLPTPLWCDLTPAEWMMRQMEDNLHMQTATWLASREITEAAGPWDIRMLTDDDGEYFCRLMMGSDEIRFVHGAKTFYRRSGSGGLSYMGSSNKKKDAQYLSMQLHIRYLLSLADHERARAACCRYLQNWLVHFYPDRTDIVQKAQQLATELGGSLQLPKMSWKYGWIQKLFGWNSALWAQMTLPRIKHGLISSYDKALSYLQ